MTTLRQAAEMALEALETLPCGDSYKTHHAAILLIKALAEVEQEPVAWMYQKNVAVDGLWETEISFNTDGYGKPLYTAPPQREWVGLTDEEIYEMGEEGCFLGNIKEISRGIETALREKNT